MFSASLSQVTLSQAEFNVLTIVSRYTSEPALIMSVIKQESNFNPLAYRAEPQINDASWGLMQILLRTAKSIDPLATASRLTNADYNVRIGTSYLNKLIAQYGNVNDALSAYNSGKPLSQAPQRTKQYVQNVLNNYRSYKVQLANVRLPKPKLSFVTPAFMMMGALIVSSVFIMMPKKQLSYA